MLKRDVLRGDFLTDAFQAAWEHALRDELVTAANVADAPAGLLRAVLVASHEGYLEPGALAEAAFVRWRAENGISAAPSSPALN